MLAYHGTSQADKVGKGAAVQYLDRILTAWMERPHPRGRFRRDITTTGEFASALTGVKDVAVLVHSDCAAAHASTQGHWVRIPR